MELLKKLTETFSPSGCEANIRRLIKTEIQPYVDEVQTDAMGNLIACKKGKSGGKKIMFAAHMDEIGLMVTYIDEAGFLRFSSIGWLPQFYALYRRVVFQNGTVGVIGYEEELEELKELKADKLYIDIGAKSRAEAEKKVAIGDCAAVYGTFCDMGDVVTAKSFDNRAGCYALIRAIQAAAPSVNDLYYVFTSQEELGLRGAKTAAFGIYPDYALAIDVTDTGDTPGAKPMAVSLGGGAAVKVKDDSVICTPEVRNRLIECAKNSGIRYQLEIMSGGGTDAGAMQLTRAGIKTGGISVPCRYIHSAVETVSKKDLECVTKLIISFSETEKWD